MASWKGHGRTTMALVVPAALLAEHGTGDLMVGVWVGLGVLCGLIIDPDLDLTTPTGSNIRVMTANPFLGRLWNLFWYPYGRLIPHRHFLSHGPIIGTIGRVMYLLAVPAALALISGYGAQFTAVFTGIFFVYWVVGLIISDVGHFLLDGCPVRF